MNDSNTTEHTMHTADTTNLPAAVRNLIDRMIRSAGFQRDRFVVFTRIPARELGTAKRFLRKHEGQDLGTCAVEHYDDWTHARRLQFKGDDVGRGYWTLTVKGCGATLDAPAFGE